MAHTTSSPPLPATSTIAGVAHVAPHPFLDRLIGETLRVRFHAETLEVFYGQRCVEMLPRLHGQLRQDQRSGGHQCADHFGVIG